jgi:hypothetical protein
LQIDLPSLIPFLPASSTLFSLPARCLPRLFNGIFISWFLFRFPSRVFSRFPHHPSHPAISGKTRKTLNASNSLSSVKKYDTSP